MRLSPRLSLRSKAVQAAAALVSLTVAGCTADVISSAPTESPEERAAKEKFAADVQPILDGFCGACHVAQANIDFMKADPDVRTTLLAWPGLIDLEQPTNSKLLSKGPHTGPAMTPDQVSTTLDWIGLEVAVIGGELAPPAETAPIQPVPGVNTIPLDVIGLEGSTVTFLYEPLSTGMYLSDIKVVAGAGGAHVVNPLFVLWPDEANPLPDPINRFGNVELDVAEATEAMVGGGTAVFVDVPSAAGVSIHFRTAEPAIGGGDGGGVIGGGCNNVPAFTASAQATLSQNCRSCHGAGGQPDAINAVDMTDIDDLSPEGQAAACGQVKTRVLVEDPNASGLFLAPDPGSGTGHPFKFGTAGQFTTFRDQVVQWITQE